MSTYHIKSLAQFQQATQKAKEDPIGFWDDIAKDNFLWRRHWHAVLSYDLSKPEVRWFEGAQLNITENCLDRHLTHNANTTALIFEPNDPSEATLHITYQQLFDRVCKMANVLKAQGVEKGDRVCLYLPMIPELTIALLACARIGAVHSVVFAGFSAKALAARINDCDCKIVITSDGAYRGTKTVDLKNIVDNALMECPTVARVLVVQRTHQQVNMKKGRDLWIEPLLEESSAICAATILDAEDPLFILYTSGSTGRPKGMVHTIGGYMVYTAYTFKNVFQYEEGDVFWCTADIGWITGHSYMVYGPLCNGATQVMFEGIPSYPDHSRFWQIVEKHKVSQFYTAPTAIRALAKQGTEPVDGYDLSSLKVLGTVGEPINEEAWNWYDEHIGKRKRPIVDTWWQTETGGIMITSLAGITPSIPTYATLPIPGIQPCLMTAEGERLKEPKAEGRLCIEFPWPSMARTIWGDHERYKQTYFNSFPGMYFTGDGARRDENGMYRITGRVDDVIIVSGHNLGTAPIEDAINEHPEVAESAVVGFPHAVKGNALYGFITLRTDVTADREEVFKKEINHFITDQIGPIAKLERIQFTQGLPKTRSGKIMRRILRKIAERDTDNLGDISTLLNPEVVEGIMKDALE